jgi:hypothetical protein
MIGRGIRRKAFLIPLPDIPLPIIAPTFLQAAPCSAAQVRKISKNRRVSATRSYSNTLCWECNHNFSDVGTGLLFLNFDFHQRAFCAKPGPLLPPIGNRDMISA